MYKVKCTPFMFYWCLMSYNFVLVLLLAQPLLELTPILQTPSAQNDIWFKMPLLLQDERYLFYVLYYKVKSTPYVYV